MQNALIRIAYRQTIDSRNQDNFSRNVLSASYKEFLLKSQAYNLEKKFTTFSQMINNDGKANSLHYKSGFAVIPFIGMLNKKIPYVQTTLGKSIIFETHEFEIIESNITDPSAHKVAIIYITGVLTFFGNMGEYMLLAEGDNLNKPPTEPVETFLIKLEPNLSVISYQQF